MAFIKSQQEHLEQCKVTRAGLGVIQCHLKQWLSQGVRFVPLGDVVLDPLSSATIMVRDDRTAAQWSCLETNRPLQDLLALLVSITLASMTAPKWI
jgi:hypothetical protein